MRHKTVVLIIVLLSVELSAVLQLDAAENLSKGQLFRTADDRQSIKIISSDELELTQGREGPHLVCNYSKENESLRVVATVLGTTEALYFKVTEQGLQSSDGTVFYDIAHFEQANRTVKLEAEAHRQALMESIIKMTPTPAPRLFGMMSISAAKAFAISTPRPEYPMEARSRHITGSGVAVLTVDVSTGVVTDARMAQSIGNPILDNAALSAYRRWRFKPGTVSKVRIPILYTMTGASY